MSEERCDVAELGGLRLEKFAPRRRVEEKIANFDLGARGPRYFLHVAQPSTGEFDSRPGAFRHGPGLEHQARDCGNRGQRLAAKAQSGNFKQVFSRTNLAGGVALEGQQSIVVAHAATIVRHADQALPSRLDSHLDATGVRVQGVLSQFLDDRGGQLHHSAGGDFVGDSFGTYVNYAQSALSVEPA